MNDNVANIIDRAVIEPDEFYENGDVIVQERCGKCKLYHERIVGHRLTSFCPHCGAKFIREKDVSTSKWIPCSERLPETPMLYSFVNTERYSEDWLLVFSAEVGEYGLASYCRDRDGKNGWWEFPYEQRLYGEDITHWMQIPKPPESEV